MMIRVAPLCATSFIFVSFSAIRKKKKIVIIIACFLVFTVNNRVFIAEKGITKLAYYHQKKEINKMNQII